ncbi:MAG: hypothetical protein GOP50_00535 [Candidatus Heimdallarchaeota archaeon]|nr:hypothetical protein [Candidatus Heimdallarchaeota archaeon]
MTTEGQNTKLLKLVEHLKKCLMPLFIEFNVDFAYLSGSWVKDHQHLESDIDIFVSSSYSKEQKGDEFLKQFADFSAKADIACKLDNLEITFLERVPLHVQFQAISDGIVIFERSEEIRLSFIENLMKYYYDHKIWFRNYLDQAV